MEQSTATIHLHRRPTVVQPLWIYTVEVDGSPVACLTVSHRQSVDVPPGHHRVRARALWWASPTLELDVEPGASLSVDIGPDVRHLWNMVVRPSAFLQVEAGHAA
jgi:hypothetical protein